MKKLSVILAVLACCGLFLGACGGDDKPHCVKLWTLIPCATEASPTGCTGATPLCCNDTCVALPTTGCADPANACTAPQVCNYCASTPACGDPAATCDPACTTGQYCDGTTCKANPVCDPVCAADEFCVD